MLVVRTRWPAVIWPCLFAVLSLLGSVAAQTPSSSSPAAAQSPTANPTAPVTSLSLTTASATLSTTVRNGTNLVPTQTVIPVVFNVTVVSTPTPSASQNASSTSHAPSATATPDPAHLDTIVDPAFGVLGAILIITGIPCAFLGHKNRWTSFFLMGFYTLSLVCIVLILKFGVLQAVNPPNRTLRGLFVLACGVAGIAGGGITIFFWKMTRYFIGAWGGLAFALWIQCFRNGGVIRPIGFRWIMYIGCAVVGFVLCTIPKIHWHIILVSTAFVGATSFMLGVDCFAATNLKEFYMWNLGFANLFPRMVEHGIHFPVSQTMQIEIGLTAAVALMGIATQFQLIKILQRKLKEIKEEAKRQDQEAVARAAELFRGVDEEKAEWEREHPELPKHGRYDSTLSGSPLLKDADGAEGADGAVNSGDEKHASMNTLVTNDIRQRYKSGVSDFNATPVDERQSPGALPTLDLGLNLENDVPQAYISDSPAITEEARAHTLSLTLDAALDLEELKKKHELLSEIQNIRKSIELLKAETPAPSSSSESRHPSFSSRRTLSYDLGGYPTAGPSRGRPLRPHDPRARVQSMDLAGHVRSDAGNDIGRPTSVPLQDDEDWEAYVRERKLIQPPSGVTAPIPTTPLSPTPLSPVPRLPIPNSVTEALMLRQRRESSLSFGGIPPVAEEKSQTTVRPVISPPQHALEDIPIALRPKHRKNDSQESYAPGTILPPRHHNGSSPPMADTQRVMSFEELEERHKEKLRQLQQPLTESEKRQAEIDAARARWERAKELEKRAVEQRQADKAAALASRQKKAKARRSADARASVLLDEPKRPAGHTRSLSADVLASVAARPGSSKRLSAMKVEDWQRNQIEDEEDDALEHPNRDTSSRRLSAVPFPASSRPRRSYDREARRRSQIPDPPS